MSSDDPTNRIPDPLGNLTHLRRTLATLNRFQTIPHPSPLLTTQVIPGPLTQLSNLAATMNAANSQTAAIRSSIQAMTGTALTRQLSAMPLATAPAIPAALRGAYLAPLAAVRADHLAAQRALWAVATAPLMERYLSGISQVIIDAARSFYPQTDLLGLTERLTEQLHRHGWYALPVLMCSTPSEVGRIEQALQRGLPDAESALISAMVAAQRDLLSEMLLTLDSLGLAPEKVAARRRMITRQFTAACNDPHVEGVAALLMAEAEGLFNDVTGLERLFYTRDSSKIRRRDARLRELHRRFPESGALYDEAFTARKLRMFEAARKKVIPARNAASHGEVSYRDRRDALWAASFLMLTLDYLAALRRVQEAGVS